MNEPKPYSKNFDRIVVEVRQNANNLNTIDYGIYEKTDNGVIRYGILVGINWYALPERYAGMCIDCNEDGFPNKGLDLNYCETFSDWFERGIALGLLPMV